MSGGRGETNWPQIIRTPKANPSGQDARGQRATYCHQNVADGNHRTVYAPPNMRNKPQRQHRRVGECDPFRSVRQCYSATRNHHRLPTRGDFQPRPTSPIEKTSHPKGLIIAKIVIVGASKRMIVASSSQFGPKRTKTTSFAKRAQAIVTGASVPEPGRIPLGE